MPAPDPYDGTTEHFTYTDWREFVQNRSPSGARFSTRDGEASLVGFVPDAKIRGALRFFLGYNNISEENSGIRTLQRTPPVYHPKYPRLICNSVDEAPFKPEPESQGVQSVKIGSRIPKDSPTDIKWRTNYAQSLVTAQFKPVRYAIKADDDITPRQEWERWTSVETEPRSDVLSLSGFSVKFTEGEGLSSPLTNPKGNSFVGEVGLIVVKSDVRFKWHSVPESYIFQGAKPPKILAGLGKVNSKNWNGYLAGTLLLEAAKLTKYSWALQDGTEDEFLYDVEFMMSFFDPEKGYTSDGMGGETQLHDGDANAVPTVEPTYVIGHNCHPWRGDFTAGDKNAGLWFATSFNGGSGADDRRLFGTYHYANLFDYWDNPIIT